MTKYIFTQSCHFFSALTMYVSYVLRTKWTGAHLSTVFRLLPFNRRISCFHVISFKLLCFVVSGVVVIVERMLQIYIEGQHLLLLLTFLLDSFFIPWTLRFIIQKKNFLIWFNLLHFFLSPIKKTHRKSTYVENGLSVPVGFLWNFNLLWSWQIAQISRIFVILSFSTVNVFLSTQNYSVLRQIFYFSF